MVKQVSDKVRMFPELFCPMCIEDPEVECERDKDVKCLHCGIELCGAHMIEHLEKAHLISTTWKGIKSGE